MDVAQQKEESHDRAYRESLGQRMELRMIRDHLDTLGTPISEAQRSKLLAIMIEEQRPLADATRSARAEPDFAALQRARADVQQRVLERAAAVLDPDQQAQLREFYTMQSPGPSLAGTTPTR